MRKKDRYSRHSGRGWAVIAAVVVFSIAATTVPIFADLGYPEEKIGEAPPALAALTRLLERLDAELEQLRDVELPALEEQVEGILALLEELASGLEAAPESGEDKPPIKAQLVKLDLMLHRLVFMLEKIVERVGATPKRCPDRERAQETLSELRQWVDGYIAGATRKMDRIEAREFERMAKAILGEVGKQLGRMAHRAREDQPEKAKLEVLLGRIEALLARLDRFIIRSFGRPPMQRPLPQAP